MTTRIFVLCLVAVVAIGNAVAQAPQTRVIFTQQPASTMAREVFTSHARFQPQISAMAVTGDNSPFGLFHINGQYFASGEMMVARFVTVRNTGGNVTLVATLSNPTGSNPALDSAGLQTYFFPETGVGGTVNGGLVTGQVITIHQMLVTPDTVSGEYVLSLMLINQQTNSLIQPIQSVRFWVNQTGPSGKGTYHIDGVLGTDTTPGYLEGVLVGKFPPNTSLLAMVGTPGRGLASGVSAVTNADGSQLWVSLPWPLATKGVVTSSVDVTVYIQQTSETLTLHGAFEVAVQGVIPAQSQ